MFPHIWFQQKYRKIRADMLFKLFSNPSNFKILTDIIGNTVNCTVKELPHLTSLNFSIPTNLPNLITSTVVPPKQDNYPIYPLPQIITPPNIVPSY
jgi:hypothetical protein